MPRNFAERAILRHFLYQDFNADEQGRPVIDGVIAHVAARGEGVSITDCAAFA